MAVKFYTTDFAGKDIADLKPLIDRLEAKLIDVRLLPTAKSLKWSGDYLKLLLKENYRHIPQLGNRTFRDHKVTIQNLELGIKIITALNQNIVLFCGCAELKNCHRFVIAGELRRKGFTVEELEIWKIAETSLI